MGHEKIPKLAKSATLGFPGLKARGSFGAEIVQNFLLFCSYMQYNIYFVTLLIFVNNLSTFPL